MVHTFTQHSKQQFRQHFSRDVTSRCCALHICCGSAIIGAAPDARGSIFRSTPYYVCFRSFEVLYAAAFDAGQFWRAGRTREPPRVERARNLPFMHDVLRCKVRPVLTAVLQWACKGFHRCSQRPTAYEYEPVCVMSL